MTTADRIKQLNDLEQDLVQLLKCAGLAVKVLTPSSTPSTDEEVTRSSASLEQQKQDFSAAANKYFQRLRSLDVGLRTQIQALQDGEIISDEATTSDQSSSAPARRPEYLTESAAVPKTSAVSKSAVSGDGLGHLDVGWLNSRNDYVGKSMEAELFKTASDFLAGLESGRSQ